MVSLDDLISTHKEDFHPKCPELGCKGTDAKSGTSYKYSREIIVNLKRFYGEESISNPQTRTLTHRSFPILIPLDQIRVADRQ